MEFRCQEEDGDMAVSSGFSPPSIRISAFSKPTLSPSSSLVFSPRGRIGGGTGNGSFLETRSGTPTDPTTTTAAAAANTIDHHPNSGGLDPHPASVTISSSGATTGSSSSGAGVGGSNPRGTTVTPTTTTTTTTKASTIAATTTLTTKSKYRECLRNHAANIGGHVVDGCGEFMPGGDPGTPDAMKCAACGCHRSFHRKESDAEPTSTPHYLFNNSTPQSSRGGAGASGGNRIPLLLLPHPHHHQKPLGFPPSPSAAIAFGGNNSGSWGTPTDSSSEELNASGAGAEMAGTSSQQPTEGARKKRFRTKFTVQQKEKMLGFAERVEWRIQRQDEAVVEQFCKEVGVRRQVLKVWMHNNKHTLGKHQPPSQHQQQDQQQEKQLSS